MCLQHILHTSYLNSSLTNTSFTQSIFRVGQFITADFSCKIEKSETEEFLLWCSIGQIIHEIILQQVYIDQNIFDFFSSGVTTGIEENASSFNFHSHDGDDRVDQPTLVYTQALNYIRRIKERSAEQGNDTNERSLSIVEVREMELIWQTLAEDIV